MRQMEITMRVAVPQRHIIDGQKRVYYNIK